jgi:gliding motility-associated-like protein
VTGIAYILKALYSGHSKKFVLLPVVILLTMNLLKSQVINNTGARINVGTGIYITSKDLNNTTLSGILNNGNLNLTGNYNNSGTIEGNGTYRLGGNWNNSGLFNEDLSTVIFNGQHNQLVTHSGNKFFNLWILNLGAAADNRIRLQNDINVLGALTLEKGNIENGLFLLYLTNTASSSLRYISQTESRIIGKFERGVGQQGTYLFPLGTSDFYNPITLKNNATPTTGSILSEYFTTSPAGAGFPFADPPVEIFTYYSGGYWTLTAKNGFVPYDYNINLKASGFTEAIHEDTRVIRRDDSSDWQVDGTHTDADTVQSIIKRNNLSQPVSASGTQFALGRPRPRIIDSPHDTTVCEESYPVFRVVATGTQSLRYRWYKVASPEDIEIKNSNPHFSGARTSKLKIIGATLSDAGYYYCVVRDRHGNETTTEQAQLTVMKIPQAVVTEKITGKWNQECSGINIDPIVLGLTYWDDPGTIFLWERDNPDGISSTVPMSGTKTAIGDIISGSFVNTKDEPVRITFNITPVGPDPTKCQGAVIPVNITVNPTPRALPVNNLPAICFGNATDIVLTTPTTMTSGNILFDYTITKTGTDVGGNELPASDISPDYHIAFNYFNNSDEVQTVSYFITPKVDNAVCPAGITVRTKVKVHPEPSKNITVLKPLTCDGGSGLGALRANITEGAEPYHIIWNGPNYYHKEDLAEIWNLSSGAYYLEVTDSLGCRSTGTSFLLPVYAEPYMYALPINPGGYNVSCIGSNDARLTIAVTGGITPPYRYTLVKNGTETVDSGIFTGNFVFTDPLTYKVYTGLSAGSYTLTITDVNNCMRTKTINMKVPPPIAASISKMVYPGGYNVTCKGYSNGSAWVASVSGGRMYYKYRWYTSDGFIPGPVNKNRIDNLKAGRYYLEVSDTLNCKATFYVDITEPEGMQLEAYQLSKSPDNNFNISCNGGNDGSIRLTINGGSGNFIYSWTGPDGYSADTRDISGLRAGSYTCNVSDINGCQLVPSPSFTLTEPAPLAISYTTSRSSDGNYEVNCNAGTGSIDVTVTGGSTGNYTYSWSTSDGSGIITGQQDQPSLTAGHYHLEVTDRNNCIISRDFVLTQPPAVNLGMIVTKITCASSALDNGSIDLNVNGGVAPYTYLWSNGATSEDISNLTAGTYSLTVNYNNTCTASGSITLDNPPALTYDVSLSNFHGYEISCNGSSDGEIHLKPLTGEGPFIYSWTGPDGFSSSSADLTGLTAGEYRLRITDRNLCFAGETITLRQPGLLNMTFIVPESVAGGFNLNCAGDSTGSITVVPQNGVNNIQYLWSDGFNGKIRNNLKAGTYDVVITDDNNCYSESSVTLTQPDTMRMSFRVIEPFCTDLADGEIALDVSGGVRGSDYAYRWSDNSTTQKISGIKGGLFVASVSDLNGCVIRDSVYVNAQNGFCLEIPNIFSPNGDLVNDEWNIGKRELYPQMEIRIFNRWGELVWRSEKGYPRPWQGTSNGRNLPIDSYHYIIDLNNGTKPIIGNITIVR